MKVEKFSPTLAQMVAIETAEMLVWAMKSLGKTRAELQGLIDDVWRNLEARDCVVTSTMLIRREAMERAHIVDQLGAEFTPARALEALEELRLSKGFRRCPGCKRWLDQNGVCKRCGQHA